jgi:tetratricopeptide (TPR) repeat protein
MRKSLYLILIVLFFTFAFSAFAQDESRASKTWQVQKYDLIVNLPRVETDRFLTAKASLELKNVSIAAASRLTLRISDKAEVSAVRVNNASAEYTKGEEKIGNRVLQRVIVRVPAIQSNQTFSVSVDYKLKVDENSGLNALSPGSSQFLPQSFWYPTPNSWFYARGADYAPVRLQVISANGETVVSSGTQATNIFENKLNGQPFFVSGNWDNLVFNNPGHYAEAFLPKGAGEIERKNAEELFRFQAAARDFVKNSLGEISNFPPIRIVAVRRGAGFSDGGAIFVDESAFRRQKIDAQTAMTVAEAIVKIWIGNSASVNGEGFGVIREGLAQYIATQFLESKYGRDIADIERLRQRTAYAAIVKRDAPLTVVSPLDDYFYTAVSNKGAMIWRLLAKRVGQDEFFRTLQSQIKTGNLGLSEIRTAFPSQKDFLDNAFDQVSETNLLIGIPQTEGVETKVALRNLGAIDATVNVSALTQTGEKLSTPVTIRAKSFGEVRFKATNKIVRVEIDTEKLYPQIDYSDDVAPREFEASDQIAVIKRAFDQQDYVKAERSARMALQSAPRFDDVRIWLARSLAAQNKNAEAEREFRVVLDEKLPTARSLAWANVGLGEISLKSNQSQSATAFFTEAIKANAEYGAALAARAGLNKIGTTNGVDESVKAFFAQFDKAAVSGRKAEIESLIQSGEMSRFSSGISGQTQQWTTRVIRVDKLDANNALAEVALNIKLLNKNPESGTAVFLLSKIAGSWKLSGVEIFEVR